MTLTRALALTSSWRRPAAVGVEVNYCDGRWAEQVKIECGIHTPEDNKMVPVRTAASSHFTDNKRQISRAQP